MLVYSGDIQKCVKIDKGVLIPVCVRTPVELSYCNAASQQIAMRDQQSLRVGSPI